MEQITRIPWPTESAPLKISARCPICGDELLLNAGEGTELDEATGQWIATEVNLDCAGEPDIESDEWDEWHKWHYSTPYIDWLPLEQKVLKEVRIKYYFEP